MPGGAGLVGRVGRGDDGEAIGFNPLDNMLYHASGHSGDFDPASNGSRKPVDAWTLLDRITAPTLIVRGELSPNLPREVIDRLRGAIRGAAVAEISGSYHHLLLDNPAEFVRVLDAFLVSVYDAGR